MIWKYWYGLRSYARSSLWIVPFIVLLLHTVTIRIVYVVDAWLGWVPPWPWGVEGTQSVLETIVSMTLTFIVFTFSSLLFPAKSQYSYRLKL